MRHGAVFRVLRLPRVLSRQSRRCAYIRHVRIRTYLHVDLLRTGAQTTVPTGTTTVVDLPYMYVPIYWYSKNKRVHVDLGLRLEHIY